MIKIIRLLTALLLISNVALAQSNSGEIYGKILDEKKQGIYGATVVATEGSIIKGGSKTDENGNYRIKPLAPGSYNVKVTFTGYNSEEVQNIPLGSDKSLLQNFQLELKTTTVGIAKVKGYKVPLIGERTQTTTGKDIKNKPTQNISDIVSLSSGTFQKKAGSGINVGGGRGGNTVYIVDGIPFRPGRGVSLPVNSISSVELMSSGVSAKFGNSTGGIVGITTNGVRSQFGGSLQLQHSVEGYNNNLMSLSASGPLFSKKSKDGGKKPLLGYSFNVSGNYDKDPDPYYYKYNRLKPEVLKRLQEHPVVKNPNGTGSGAYIRASEQVTANDFEKIKARENGDATGFNYNGKFDFQATDNMNITLGTAFVYGNSKGYSYSNSLFAPEANSINKSYRGNGYLRLTQRLGKSGISDKQEKKSAISNAFYSIQFSYQKDVTTNVNPDHGKKIFDYGYLGKFHSYTRPYYQLDTAKGGLQGQKYFGNLITDSVTFTPGGVNPLLENYTKAIFDDPALNIFVLDQVPGLGALRNGDAPQSAYGIWTGTGSQISGFGNSDNDQISLNLDASFDIAQGSKNKKNKDAINHNIQFGIGYDQTTYRGYSLGASGLWRIMREITNRQFSKLDLQNPQFWVGGTQYTYDQVYGNGSTAPIVQFGPFDTIRYNNIYVANDQARIDKELRMKMFGDIKNQTYIDIDNLDPSTFNINMFSADDLYNKGIGSAVSYFGYDYLGKKLNKQPSFNDFWSKKDSRGDYLRPIGALRPIYMFGYILDKFTYKDLKFNIGLRIDRYDGNQKTLKDPYSLYGVRKAGDIAAGTYDVAIDRNDNDKAAPAVSSFNSNYVVYVNSNEGRPTVVGYRNGDTWYDPFGKEIADPTILSGLYAGGLPIQPWLTAKIDSTNSIKSSGFNPDNSFTDYKPEVSLSPRIQFEFPISDNALLYGNYDIMTQNPNAGNSFVTPDDYFYLAERQGAIANANLRMEKAINFALGYQQKLTKKSSITIEAFYKERKNQIQIQQYLLAYPITYKAYGNRDFSSTKGLIVKLDFRRQGPVQMNIDYTLQFAEGTGSNSTSQSSLLASGQPNLRTVLPLDFDARHVLNVGIDYRYEGDKMKGPKIGNSYPFKNAGLNFLFRTYSGTPYTRAAVATPIVGGDFNSGTIVGSINGSRLPWSYEVSLKADKSIFLGYYGKKVGKDGTIIRAGKPLAINIYAFVQNLLNTRNLQSVYGYTGSGTDDGYLTSPQGQQALAKEAYQQSYTDLYNTRLSSPGNFNNPRRIYIGINFDF